MQSEVVDAVCSGSDQKLVIVEWLRWLIDQAEHFEQ